jgi:flagellar motor switch protein FliN/FliY
MKLSQAEIDALLNRSAPEADAREVESEIVDITEAERDALGEIGNISFGSAATSLSTLLQQRVEITTPHVSVLRSHNVQDDFPRPYVMVTVDFTEGLSGANALAIELNDAKTIADLMLGGDGRNVAGELNDLHLSAVAEAMNQMMGGAATAMSTMFGFPINISPPKVNLIDFAAGDKIEVGRSEWLVNTAFSLRVGDLIDSKIMQLVPVSFAKELLGLLHGSGDQMVAATQSAVMERPASAQSAPVLAQSPQSAPANVDTNTHMPQVPVQQSGMAVTNQVLQMPVHRPEFADFSNDEVVAINPRNLALLYDVALNVTVELGRTRKSIRDVLDLAPGSIIELDKLAGEPVDIYVNNKRIATGEVVVIDENFGVRVTDIVSPVERVKQLQ